MQCDKRVEEDNEGTEDMDIKRKMEEDIDRQGEAGMHGLKVVAQQGIHNSHMEIENWDPLMYKN